MIETRFPLPFVARGRAHTYALYGALALAVVVAAVFLLGLSVHPTRGQSHASRTQPWAGNDPSR